jgi:hypothetical protein
LISEGGVRSGGIEKAGHDSSFLFNIRDFNMRDFNIRDFNIRDPWGMKHRGRIASSIEGEPVIKGKMGIKGSRVLKERQAKLVARG